MFHQSILQFRGARFGWWSAILIILAVGLFLSTSDFQPPNGGTWQGYVLGSIGLVLIVWLTALGIVKRRYSGSNLQAWTSAHVYLGSALLVVGSLHSALQFGFNVHTLAYLFMCLVILSGFVGVFFYLRYPTQMARNRNGLSREQLFGKLSELNEQSLALAGRCHVNVRTAVETAVARTAIGGGFWDQLLGRDKSTVVLVTGEADEGVERKTLPNRRQQAIVDYVAKCIPRARKQGEASQLQSLLENLCRRQLITEQIRQDIKYAARLKVWLWVHIPFTVALLVALLIHVVSVFFYW